MPPEGTVPADDIRPQSPADQPPATISSASVGGSKSVTLCQCLMLLMACVVPCALLVGGFSYMGMGLKVMNTVAPKDFNLLGNLCLMGWAAWVCLLYVFDAHKTHICLRLPIFVVTILGLVAAAVLKAIWYPWAPMLLLLFLELVALGEVRVTSCKQAARGQFYNAVGSALIGTAFSVLLVWVSWMFVTENTWTQATKDRLIDESAKIYESVHTKTVFAQVVQGHVCPSGTLVGGELSAMDCADKAVADKRTFFSFREPESLGQLGDCYLEDGSYNLDENTSLTCNNPLSQPVDLYEIKKSLNYEQHCKLGVELSGYLDAEKKSVLAACKTAASVWFMVWVAPFIAVATNLILGIFSYFAAYMHVAEDAQMLQSTILKFFMLIVFVMSGMYCSLYVSGGSVWLASAFMGFFSAAGLATMVWLYLEVPKHSLEKIMQESRVAGYLAKAYKSDWVKAIGLGMVNVFIPVFFLLDRCRQKIRRCRGTASSDGLYTTAGQRVMDELKHWDLCGILIKVAILGELWFMLIVGMKVTFVFFSWLCDLLRGTDFGIVCALVVVVGYGMFLIPAVPGSAVYMFAGIVLGDAAQQPGSVGLWPGVIVAVILGLITKLMACTGQYYIGFFAGRSLKVQQQIAVDSVPTRAVEYIVRQPGWTLGKVAILVGGPDWPTSVCCGILKVNVPQMLLGTLPVVVASIAPQTLMGALLTVPKGDSTTTMLSTIATGTSAICQMAASLTAAYIIKETIESRHDELAKPRPEHATLEKLREEQKAAVEAYKIVTTWDRLSSWRKVLLGSAAGFQLLAGSLYMMDMVLVNKVCFRKFAIKNRIDDPEILDGLDGDVMNLVINPMGYISTTIYILAFFLHYAHAKFVSRDIKKVLSATETSVPSVVVA
eukprot:TRINITY_DN31741_c0_g1_i1.p1 TRINITY_DN31741_c0_g1~~TRINITY_DN31741_c0_g1_i1.p1  ORF type:complete len:888 (+),score=187.25 TRINITY_DN31741_c0_g1_i1:159-2822(+)